MEAHGYGVCRLAVVPVRNEPDDRSEQVTQLLFGDHYQLMEANQDRKWLRIRIQADDYQGWIDVRQHHEITTAYFEQINHANYKIVTDPVTSILYRKSPLTILMGSIVPISNSELFKMEEQFAFNGETKSLGQRRDFEFLQSIAMRYLNAPYQWGGKNPFGIDCSGLVQMVYKINGYALPRDAADQWKSGREIKTFEDAAPGDLAFFQNAKGQIGHVGIVLDDNRIIHASGKVRVDHLMEEGIMDLETKIITHMLAGFRRILMHLPEPGKK